jgi:hypothetical protein
VLESHARTLNDQFPRKQAYVKRLGVPYYAGEFNVVNRIAGGDRVMREYYDRMAAFGWTATMWSYKLLKRDGGVKPDQWYMITNEAPLPTLDLQTSSYEDFEGFFKSLATMELAVNQPLRTALTEPKPPPLPLSTPQPLPTTAPSGNPPEGFTAVDIGDAMPGGNETSPDGVLTVYASGANIFSANDSFRFISRPADSTNQTLVARVLSLLNSHAYAKAGVMARWGNESDAAFAMANIFPDGTVCLIGRDTRGAQAKEIKLASAGATPPVDLRIVVDSGHATGSYRPADGTWQQIGSLDVPTDPNYRIGLAVTSHDNSVLTAAKFRLGEGPPPRRPAPVASKSLLEDMPFDRWSSEGQWQSDAATAAATASKKVRLWRDVEVEAGKRYTFTVAAKQPSDSAENGDGTVEVSLEGWVADYQVALNSNTFRAADLPRTGMPKSLAVTATAIGPKLRVCVILAPSEAAQAQGAKISFEAPTLSRD